MTFYILVPKLRWCVESYLLLLELLVFEEYSSAPELANTCVEGNLNFSGVLSATCSDVK